MSLYGETNGRDMRASFSNFFSQIATDDYVAVLAYLTEESATEYTLREICRELENRMRVTTTLGYGPRYLHSNGQYHKGDPIRGCLF